MQDLMPSFAAMPPNRQQMDTGYRQQTPGYPEYAQQARRDLWPTPLDFLSQTMIPGVSDAADLGLLYQDREQYSTPGLLGMGAAAMIPGVSVGMIKGTGVETYMGLRNVVKQLREKFADVPGQSTADKYEKKFEREKLDELERSLPELESKYTKASQLERDLPALQARLESFPDPLSPERRAARDAVYQAERALRNTQADIWYGIRPKVREFAEDQRKNAAIKAEIEGAGSNVIPFQFGLKR